MNFDKLTAYLDNLHTMGVPGCDLTVYQDHQEIYRHFTGHRDAEGKLPMQGNETYCLYSCTKVVTTLAAMQLIGRKQLFLDAPVSDYLPAFAHLTVKDGEEIRPAKRVMTIRHLMSMQGGLDYDWAPIREVIDALGEEATTRQVVDLMAKKPLLFEPGENFQYSLCHDVLAAVVEVVSGQKYSDYLKEHIFAPLGLSTISFDFTPDILERLCAKYRMNEKEEPIPVRADEIAYRPAPRYESGGAGLISDVKDYARILDAIACEGETEKGEKLLSPQMIQLWNSNQLGFASRRTFDHMHRLGYSYALGVRTRVNTRIGGKGTLGEFGWDGAAGAWGMMDPTHHLSAVYAQHILGHGNVYTGIHPVIRSLIYECMEL